MAVLSIMELMSNILMEKQRKFSFQSYFVSHLQSCISSFGRLMKTPFSSLTTFAVIGIALALPLGMLVVLQNIQDVSHSWDKGTQISLFLKINTSNQEAQDVARQLQENANIASINYISPEQGLKEFEQQSGFEAVISQLKDNPLPIVLEVHPRQSLAPFAIQQLFQSLKQNPQVETAQLDMEWIKRLYGYLALAQNTNYALSLLFGLGIFLIIGNTIRLATEKYKKEIEVIKLVGATNAFVRRPFLYSGIHYGFFGGLIAVTLVGSFLLYLEDPVEHLANLYHSSFYLHGLNFGLVILVLFLSSMLGLSGSWLAVRKHLNNIKPE